jgi:3-phosphoshikimate 1-carboxyvinyltransferase
MRTAGGSATIAPSNRAVGQVTVPGDKSISHRYAMLAALAEGVSTIRGFATGFDCWTTLACLRALGVRIEWTPDVITISATGPEGLRPSRSPLDAENSGTTMRLLAGILAGQPFRTELTGDESLSRRPMRRVIVPLTAMGARVSSSDGRPPLVIDGAPLRAIVHTPEVPSAQVKSCVLLAGLHAEGTTTIEEHIPTRDHTERAFETFGVRLARGTNTVSVAGGQRLKARDVTVPGDISGAAFWCALAAATPDGDITIDGVGLNPTRTGVLDILRRAGAEVTVDIADPAAPEPSGTVRVRCRDWRSFALEPVDVAGVIDEIPALAALAAMMPDGRSLVVRGARELRVKESDRIAALASGFRAMGSDVEEYDDGFMLTARPLRGAIVDAADDHRLAMAFMIAATRASAPVTIHDATVAAVSYPNFFETLAGLIGDPSSRPSADGSMGR